MNLVHITDAFSYGRYTTSYLSRQFHKEMGITFSGFLKHTRIEASCRLLVSTAQSVSTIAEAVGYHDATFFYKTFRQIKGISPYEFRRLIGNEP